MKFSLQKLVIVTLLVSGGLLFVLRVIDYFSAPMICVREVEGKRLQEILDERGRPSSDETKTLGVCKGQFYRMLWCSIPEARQDKNMQIRELRWCSRRYDTYIWFESKNGEWFVILGAQLNHGSGAKM